MAQLKVFSRFGKKRWLKIHTVNKKDSLFIRARIPIYSSSRRES